MGRPPSLSDHDIDVDLPLDVDEANRDIDVLRQASSAEVDKTIPAFPQKTMTCFIHLLRLRRIDSDIQHHIYRVDRRTTSKDIYEATDMFLEKLTAWKDAIPHESTEWDPTNRHEFRGDEYRSYDSYVCPILSNQFSCGVADDHRWPPTLKASASSSNLGYTKSRLTHDI